MCAGFLALLLMNLRITRFWCRALCPLGALLGVASRWSILGLHKDAATCNKCSRCEINCQGGDDPIGGAPWHKTECHLCLNCVEACPKQLPLTEAISDISRDVLVQKAKDFLRG